MTGNVKQGETQRSWQTDSSRQCCPPPLLSFHSLYLHLVEYYTKSYLLWARICVERVSTDFLPGLPRAAALNFILHTVKYHNTAQVPQQLHMLSASPCIISVLCPQSSHHTNPILVLISIFDKRASFSASVHICKVTFHTFIISSSNMELKSFLTALLFHSLAKQVLELTLIWLSGSAIAHKEICV